MRSISWIRLLVAIVLVVSLGGCRRARTNDQLASLARLARVSSVKVYGPSAAPVTLRAVASFELRGIQAELVPVTTMLDLQRENLPKRLSDQGLLVGTTLSMPFAEVGSQLVSFEDLGRLFAATPATSFGPERPEPYVVVYGVRNCGYTAAATKELERAGIPYELRDLNESPAMGAKAESRLEASGYHEDRFATPIVEVNGYVRPRMPIAEIERRYRR